MKSLLSQRRHGVSPSAGRKPIKYGALLLTLFLLSGCVTQATQMMTRVMATVTVELASTPEALPAPATPSTDDTGLKPTVTPSEAADAETENMNDAGADEPAEQPVTIIPLAAPLDDAEMEYSGMAWYGDRLVLLPQYPERYAGQLPILARRDLLAFLRGELDGPPAVESLAFDDGGLSTMITGYQGYEAIAFDGDQAYLTIETRPGNWMLGYVVAATVTPDGDALQLAPMQRAPAPVQAALGNMTDESLIIDGERVITLYEANGAVVNSEPVANVYSRALEKLEPISFPNIEYRITDATEVDDEGRFWAINYFFPGDEKLEPADDVLAEKYGEGPTHSTGQPVERLVEFQIGKNAIELVDAPPIQLRLSPLRLARNWEGIVRLESEDLNGFLLITDKFPSTVLAFVPLPEDR